VNNPKPSGRGPTKAGPSPRLLLVALGLMLGLVLAACGDARVRLQQDLDTFPLPEHVELVESRIGGPPYCFIDCPNVVRYHVSVRSVEETCQSLQEAVEQWGVTDASWNIGESEFNPCTMSATRKGNEFTVSVYDASRLAPDVASNLEPGELETYQAAVNTGLWKPDSFLDTMRRMSLILPPWMLLPLILGLLIVVVLAVWWYRKRRRASRAMSVAEP
jgi:hypothetical protein